MRELTQGEFNQNVNRVDSLIGAYHSLEERGLGDPQERKDILRAAVVFMHSTLEEIVRNLYLWRLPDATQENLNKIPFGGHATTSRPKGILLGELREYKGRSVENIIYESIDKYANTMNLNNATQLSGCLEAVGISPNIVEQYFPLLDELMQRRHQIVHQMDRDNALDPLDYPVTDIAIQSVLQWKDALHGFFGDVLAVLPEE